MIAEIAIATGLLAILEDDSGIDYQELFERARLLGNPDILYDRLTHEVRQQFKKHFLAWFGQADSLEELKRRIDEVDLFWELMAGEWTWMNGNSEEYPPQFLMSRGMPVFSKRKYVGFWEDGFDVMSNDQLKMLFKVAKDPSVEILNVTDLRDHCLTGIPDALVSWDEDHILLVSGFDDEERGEHFQTEVIPRPTDEELGLNRTKAIELAGNAMASRMIGWP